MRRPRQHSDEQGDKEDRRRQRKEGPTLDAEQFISRLQDAPKEQVLDLTASLLTLIKDATTLEEVQEGASGIVVGSYLLDAPVEILEKIATELPLSALRALCLSNRQMAQICASDPFWRNRVRKEFGRDTPLVFASWKKMSKRVPPRWHIAFSSPGESVKMIGFKVAIVNEDDSVFPAQCDEQALILTPNFNPLRTFLLQYFDGTQTMPLVFRLNGRAVVFLLKSVGDAVDNVGVDVRRGIYVTPDESITMVISDYISYTTVAFRGPKIAKAASTVLGEEVYMGWVQQCDDQEEEDVFGTLPYIFNVVPNATRDDQANLASRVLATVLN